MALNAQSTAQEIVELVGGSDNVRSVTHCITRVRFVLVDESKVNDKDVEDIDGVIKVVHAGNQYQVVIGPKVEQVYDVIASMMADKAKGEVAEDDGPADADDSGAKGIGAVLDIITGIFSPFLGTFVAAGLVKALAVMLSSFGLLDAASSTYAILNAVGDGLFQFLPIILGFSAGEKFGVNKWVTAAIAAFLCHGDIAALSTTFADGATFCGIPVSIPGSGYLQSVIPIILSAWLQKYVEKAVKKLPDSIRGLFGNMIVLLVVGLATLLVVGPVTNLLSTLIADGLLALIDAVPIVAGFLFAGLWPILIIFGMHWAFVPVILSNFATLGYDYLFPIIVGTNFAVGGACLAIFLKSKNDKVKSVAGECVGTSWLGGITEPAIYGLLLKYRRAFISMCVACGVAGAFAAVFSMTQTAMLTVSLITLPALYAMCGLPEVIAAGIAAVVAFVLTYAWGFDDSMVEA